MCASQTKMSLKKVASSQEDEDVDEKDPPGENRSSACPPFGLVIAMVITALSYFSIWMQEYALTEWIQHQVEEDLFRNSTVLKNFSACHVNHSDPDYKKHEKVQQVSAKWQMYNTIATKSVALLTTFLFTVYTDVFGRRFLFILSTFSIFFNIFMNALVMYFDLGLIYIVISCGLYGLTGTSYGLLSVAYSYVADVTQAGKGRSFAIFMMSTSMSIASTTAGLVVGIFIQKDGFINPMFTASGTQAFIVLIAIFVLPESLHKKDRIKPPPLLKSIYRPFAFYTSKEFRGSRSLFIMMIFAFIFTDMTGVHRQTTETLYQLGMPFCWSPSKIGLFATLCNVCKILIGIAAMKGLQRCLPDITIAMISLTFNAASFILEGTATTELMLLLVAIPAALENLPSPLVRGTMSAMTSANQQGALFASIQIVQTLCSFVTGITDNMTYAATLPIYNGFVFFLFALYCVLGFVFMLAYKVLKRRSDTRECLVNEQEETATAT